MKPFVLGSRGSALALAQARFVKARLESARSGRDVEIKIIKTTGDRMADASLSSIGGKGVFTKELEDALLNGTVDAAVHSLKDLPTEYPPGLTLGAVLEREDPRDCVVARFGEQLREMPRGAVIGTSSLRRQAQIRAGVKGVRVQDLRGNLDTRLAKVAAGEVSAVVVAYAGLRRLGRAEEVTELLSPDQMTPAPAQGCVAVEIRDHDEPSRDIVSVLDHAPSRRAARAERAFLSALGGGCRVPIAAYAREEQGRLVLDGLVISVDGSRQVRDRESGPCGEPEGLGAQLAERLIARGARALLAP